MMTSSNRVVGGLRAFEDFVHVGGSAAAQVNEIDAVGHETTRLGLVPYPPHRGEPGLRGEFGEPSSVLKE